MLGTQYFALDSAGIDGTAIPDPGTNGTDGEKALGELKLSDYFEDAEGVVNLIYSVGDLSDDDKKIVDVFLLDFDPDPTTDRAGFEDADDNAVTTSKSSVTGEESYLAIVAKAAGSVTFTLTVKDGLPGGVSTFERSVSG